MSAVRGQAILDLAGTRLEASAVRGQVALHMEALPPLTVPVAILTRAEAFRLAGRLLRAAALAGAGPS